MSCIAKLFFRPLNCLNFTTYEMDFTLINPPEINRTEKKKSFENCYSSPDLNYTNLRILLLFSGLFS